MTTNPLPDLSTWYEVPADADIPKGVRFAYFSPDDEAFDVTSNCYGRTVAQKSKGRYFTADPIPAPRPAPPTKPGTVLANVTNGRDDCAVMIYHDSEWRGTDQDGDDRLWQTEDLVSWVVADVVPRKPDPLDENDHRDRRYPNGKWEWSDLYPKATTGRIKLADCKSWASLRFADEVQS